MLGTLLGCYRLGWGMFQAGCAHIWEVKMLGAMRVWISPVAVSITEGSSLWDRQNRVDPAQIIAATSQERSVLEKASIHASAMQDICTAPASGRRGGEEGVWHHLSPTQLPQNHSSEIQSSSQVSPFFLSSFHLHLLVMV